MARRIVHPLPPLRVHVPTAALDGMAARGLAGEAGLMPRDIILRMRTKPVVDSEALDDIIADVKPGSIVPVLVLRQQRRIFLTLKVPEDD